MKTDYNEFLNEVIEKGFTHYAETINENSKASKVFKNVVCNDMYNHYMYKPIKTDDIFIENYNVLLKHFEEIEDYGKCSNLVWLYESIF